MNNCLVIIPTFNEKENIEAIIKAIFSLPVHFDILVVDDSSPDGTASIVKNLQKATEKLPNIMDRQLHLIERKEKSGLGTAYITGFKYALEHGYDYIFEMDADFSHDPADLVRLFRACAEEGYDLAIGSRYITGVNVVNWPMGRVLMSYFASVYVRFITGMAIQDTTAGFKCYRSKVLRTINLDKIKFIGYAFQIEMKFSTWKYGFKIKEVPIIFTDRTKGTSKMSSGIFKEAVLGVIQMKVYSWFKKYPKPVSG
ncbi:MAG: polyprenol monophosphomannose synthase [Candidatus Cyclobacteriaceae bacterium M3_2C_046]